MDRKHNREILFKQFIRDNKGREVELTELYAKNLLASVTSLLSGPEFVVYDGVVTADGVQVATYRDARELVRWAEEVYEIADEHHVEDRGLWDTTEDEEGEA